MEQGSHSVACDLGAIFSHQYVPLDHEGGKGLLRVRNKVVMFNRDADSIFSDSTLTLGEAVQRACTAVRNDSTR